MAAEIKSEFDVDSQLAAGSGGVYKITADETVIYSKHDSGNEFPQDGQVTALIREYQQSLA